MAGSRGNKKMAGLEDRDGRIELTVQRMKEASRKSDDTIENSMAELVRVRVDSAASWTSAPRAPAGGSAPGASASARVGGAPRSDDEPPRSTRSSFACRITSSRGARGAVDHRSRRSAFPVLGSYVPRQAQRLHEHIVLLYENDEVSNEVEAHLNEGEKDFAGMGAYVVIHKRPMAPGVARRRRGLRRVIGIITPYAETLGGYRLQLVNKSRAPSPNTRLFAVQEDGSLRRLWTDGGDRVKVRRSEMKDVVPHNIRLAIDGAVG